MKFLCCWVLVWSIAAFIAMGIDKRRAKRRAWRVREVTLFLLALLGGGAGGTLGMLLFRHKTKHWYFRFGFPLLAILQLGLLLLMYVKGYYPVLL